MIEFTEKGVITSLKNIKFFSRHIHFIAQFKYPCLVYNKTFHAFIKKLKKLNFSL